MDIQTLETQIAMALHFTDTISGCRAAIHSLDHLSYIAESQEERDLINKTRDDVFEKGQKMQLIENQKAWVGEYNGNK